MKGETRRNKEREGNYEYGDKLIGQEIKEDGNEVWFRRLSFQCFYPDMPIQNCSYQWYWEKKLIF